MAPERRGPLVLVVDDELMILHCVHALLSAEGYEVVTTSSAAEAARLAESLRPSVVLTDLWMRGLDGIELAQLLQHVDPQLPLVVMTGAPSDESRERATRAGARSVLVKPIERATLLAALDRARAPVPG